MRRWRPWRSQHRQTWFVAAGLVVLGIGGALASFAVGFRLPSQPYGAWTKRLVPVSRPVALRSHPVGKPPTVDDAIDLPSASLRIIETLRTAPEVRAAEPHDVAYEAPPALSDAAVWQEFESSFSRSRELQLSGTFDHTKWIALQLYIHDWDQLVEQMRATGLLEQMDSSWVGEVMLECCRSLISQFSVHTAFTQSDEIILLFAPREHHTSPRNLKYKGRVHKWVSIAASLCTWEFTRRLQQLAAVEGLEFESPLIANFAGRASNLDSELEVSALLLWRAHVNGVRELRKACWERGAPSHCANGDLTEQVAWLHDFGHLPLEAHIAYGTLLRVADMQVNATNPMNNETVLVWRGFVIQTNGGAGGVPRNLLNFCRRGLSLLPDEGDENLQLRPGNFWRSARTQGHQQQTVKLYRMKKMKKNSKGGFRRA